MVQPQLKIQAPVACVKRGQWERGVRVLFAGWLLTGAACGVSDAGKLPPDVEDRNTLRTPSGALALYRQTLTDFSMAFDGVMTTSGILTDEIAALPLVVGTSGAITNLDSRQGSPAFSPARLHRLRAQAREARGFLQAYASDNSSALPGHMYAVEAYAELFLADIFCSGIPLSTVNFEGDYTLAAGSTTAEVYGHAVALFDTALTLTGDSVNLQYLTSVGKGRALLALDNVAAAAAAVAGVPDAYRYNLVVTWTPSGGGFTTPTTTPPDSLKLPWYWTRATTAGNNDRRVGGATVANQEGGNGLDYRTSGDPRTQFVAKGVSSPADTLYMPRKYTSNGTAVANSIPFTLASGIEARLIEAEAALRANADDGRWLQVLNHLRQTMWTSIFPATAGPLPDLADPGTAAARVDLLFRERAFWLYLTAQRHGDLRRLIRQYQRLPETVFPTGSYRGGSGQYGNQVVLPMPDSERQLNSLYTGCFHQNA